MRRSLPFVVAVVAACASSRAALAPAAQAQTDSARQPYSAADVAFMTGMIPHHAQAVLMAGWAPTHDAGAAVRVLSERIVVAQTDEIEFMRTWLADRGLEPPAADALHHAIMGMDHAKLMPGMLTAEQLARLDRARGTEFDRLFLEFMIQHHEGAVTMVEALFASHGAAQDDAIFKFAADVSADQTSEIERMNIMLAAMAAGGTNQ